MVDSRMSFNDFYKNVQHRRDTCLIVLRLFSSNNKNLVSVLRLLFLSVYFLQLLVKIEILIVVITLFVVTRYDSEVNSSLKRLQMFVRIYLSLTHLLPSFSSLSFVQCLPIKLPGKIVRDLKILSCKRTFPFP